MFANAQKMSLSIFFTVVKNIKAYFDLLIADIKIL